MKRSSSTFSKMSFGSATGGCRNPASIRPRRKASSCFRRVYLIADQLHFRVTAAEFLHDLGKTVEGRARLEADCKNVGVLLRNILRGLNRPIVLLQRDARLFQKRLAGGG